MKTFQAIQYVERHQTEELAKQCLYSLSRLQGYIGGRATSSPDFEHPEEKWVTQALFECETDINPNAIGSCYGMRIVQVPLTFIAMLCKDQCP